MSYAKLHFTDHRGSTSSDSSKDWPRFGPHHQHKQQDLNSPPNDGKTRSRCWFWNCCCCHRCSCYIPTYSWRRYRGWEKLAIMATTATWGEQFAYLEKNEVLWESELLVCRNIARQSMAIFLIYSLVWWHHSQPWKLRGPRWCQQHQAPFLAQLA